MNLKVICSQFWFSFSLSVHSFQYGNFPLLNSTINKGEGKGTFLFLSGAIDLKKRIELRWVMRPGENCIDRIVDYLPTYVLPTAVCIGNDTINCNLDALSRRGLKVCVYNERYEPAMVYPRMHSPEGLLCRSNNPMVHSDASNSRFDPHWWLRATLVLYDNARRIFKAQRVTYPRDLTIREGSNETYKFSIY